MAKILAINVVPLVRAKPSLDLGLKGTIPSNLKACSAEII